MIPIVVAAFLFSDFVLFAPLMFCEHFNLLVCLLMAVVMQFLPVEGTPKGCIAIPFPSSRLLQYFLFSSLGKGKQQIKNMFTDDDDGAVTVIKVGP